MKLWVLGSGTCFPPVRDRVFRLPPLFVVTLADGDGAARAVVFDCSEGARWRLREAGVDPSRVEHVAVSHAHADHAALPSFLQARTCAAIADPSPAAPLRVYLPARSAATLAGVLRWHKPEDDEPFSSRYRCAVVGAADGEVFALHPGVALRAFAVRHGRGLAPALAWRLEGPEGVFAYSGDTGICDGVVRAARGADLFVCDASTPIGGDMSQTQGHLNPRQAAALAREAGARSLLLTHHTGCDEDEAMVADARASGYAGDCTVAHDGQVVTFGAATTGESS